MAETSYVRVRRLEAGTFNPGEDWAAQFDTSDGVVVSAIPTAAGEMLVPEGSLTDLMLIAADSSAAAIFGLMLCELKRIRQQLQKLNQELPTDD